MVSTNLIQKLPALDELQRLCRSLAMLDAIMSPEWEYRYFSFNSKWGDGEKLGSMRNGSGDEYFICFNDAGAIIKGFDHESEMSPYAKDELSVWLGVLDNVPSAFNEFLIDPSMPPEYATFCVWRLNADIGWRAGEIEYPRSDAEADGSEWLLFALDGKPETYVEFAADYYETDVPLATVQKIYGLEPLDDEMVNVLNSDIELSDLTDDIEEIGYPRV